MCSNHCGDLEVTPCCLLLRECVRDKRPNNGKHSLLALLSFLPVWYSSPVAHPPYCVSASCTQMFSNMGNLHSNGFVTKTKIPRKVSSIKDCMGILKYSYWIKQRCPKKVAYQYYFRKELCKPLWLKSPRYRRCTVHAYGGSGLGLPICPDLKHCVFIWLVMSSWKLGSSTRREDQTVIYFT